MSCFEKDFRGKQITDQMVPYYYPQHLNLICYLGDLAVISFQDSVLSGGFFLVDIDEMQR